MRPLLEFRRDELRDYLKQHSQAWREDASNEDTTFARNKVRRELMPKLREVNPSIEQVLSEAAEIARGDESYWQQVVEKSVDGRWSMVDGKHLLEQPLALRRRMVRAVAERRGIALEFRHVEQILELVAQPATRAEKRVELPGEWDAVVQERELRFARRCPKQQNDSYEYALSVPGKVEVEAAGLTIAARFLERGEGDLLDPGRIGSLHIRNWRPGDRYRPAHTRQAKKLKELLQARSVPAEFRAHWPVVVSQIEGREEIVWVPGFACAEGFLRAHGSASGIRLEHKPR